MLCVRGVALRLMKASRLESIWINEHLRRLGICVFAHKQAQRVTEFDSQQQQQAVAAGAGAEKRQRKQKT